MSGKVALGTRPKIGQSTAAQYRFGERRAQSLAELGSVSYRLTQRSGRNGAVRANAFVLWLPYLGHSASQGTQGAAQLVQCSAQWRASAPAGDALNLFRALYISLHSSFLQKVSRFLLLRSFAPTADYCHHTVFTNPPGQSRDNSSCLLTLPLPRGVSAFLSHILRVNSCCLAPTAPLETSLGIDSDWFTGTRIPALDPPTWIHSPSNHLLRPLAIPLIGSLAHLLSRSIGVSVSH